MGNPAPPANRSSSVAARCNTSANLYDYSSRFSTAAGQQYNVDINGQNVTWAANLTSTGGPSRSMLGIAGHLDPHRQRYLRRPDDDRAGR